MAGPYSVGFNPDKDPGEKLAPEIRAEIAEVAPSTVTAGSIDTDELAEAAVETSKLADEAITEPKHAEGGVSTRALAAESVTEPKLSDNSVTGAKAGLGTVTSVDFSDAFVETAIKFVTAVEMASITSPDPNTLYFVSA